MDSSETIPEADVHMQEFKVPDLNVLSRIKVKPKETQEPPPNIPAFDAEAVQKYSVESNVNPPDSKSCQSKDAGNVDNTSRPEIDAAHLAKYASMVSQLKYQEPVGAAPFDSRYGLEVLRNGSIISNITFKTDKSFYVVGRLPLCDISGEHPTISRMHAIIQYVGLSHGTPEASSSNEEYVTREDCKQRGLYVYDLNSTHGTFLNKNQLIPGRFYRLHVGHVLKFGNSTRLYVVLGPDDDAEEESEKTLTELMKERDEKQLKRTWRDGAPGQEVDSDEEDQGVSWGMGEDAVEETGMSVNPFALDIEDSSELSLDNPKRTLHSWFEREGYDLVYDVNEKSSGHFICTINLPLDSTNGTPVIAEVDGKGKKKEIMAQCALKACQILDKYGVLRKSNQESHRRKSKDWEEKDYYSSDEDTFLDRTGSVEKKRKQRMKQAGKLEEKVETYDSLVAQYNDISTRLDDLNNKMQKAQEQSKQTGGTVGTDSLEEFMQDLKTGVADISKMKSQLKDLTEEQRRILQLINIAKPAGVTFPVNQHHSATKSVTPTKDTDTGVKMATKILFGPRKGFSGVPKKCVALTVPKTVKPKSAMTAAVEEQDVILIEHGEEQTEHVKNTSDPKPAELGKLEVVPGNPVVSNDEKLPSKGRTGIDNEDSGESDTEKCEENVPKQKSKRPRRHTPKKPVTYEYDSANPDYSVWVPPSDQTGDGKTKLNEKLGY